MPESKYIKNFVGFLFEDAKENGLDVIKVKSYYEISPTFTGIALYPNGTKTYFRNGKFHRKNGPAMETPEGHRMYYFNGEPHREDGPAMELVDGTKYYYLRGVEMSEQEYWDLTPEQRVSGL